MHPWTVGGRTAWAWNCCWLAGAMPAWSADPAVGVMLNTKVVGQLEGTDPGVAQPASSNARNANVGPANLMREMIALAAAARHPLRSPQTDFVKWDSL